MSAFPRMLYNNRGITLLALLMGLLTLTPALNRPLFAQERLPDVTDLDRTMLKTLKVGHPRLIALEADITRARQMIAQDPLAKSWRDRLHAQAEKVLGEPVVEHKLIGPRLLDKSRRALDRIYTLALMYRLEGDKRFAERARQEILGVCAFKDWNPSHFLDTAEMSHAVGIGYDWLYDTLGPEDRANIRTALVDLGLKPSLDLYRKQQWWVVVKHNWNQVCNGGMTLGALAIADEEPDLAAFILSHAIPSVKRALATYAPDGGWPEGPGYWNYATSYTVYLLAGLQTALDTDFGLSQMPGLAETGMFRLHFTGPTDLVFNFADGGSREGRAPVLFWMARRFHRPLYAWMERQGNAAPQPLDLLWFDPEGQGPAAEKVPTSAQFPHIAVAFLRSAWEDPNALFVGFKGGDNAANHSHLDLGTFVLDAAGQRWAVDLGGDNYNLPGYFGKERFTYYRLRTEAHNTLTLNGENQDTKAKAPIIASSSDPANAFAVADLSAAYQGQAKSVWRGIKLVNGTQVLVEDELEAIQPVDMMWGMLTPAQVQLDGASATLKIGNAALFARVLEPQGAHFELLSANPPPPQGQNPGVQKLAIHLPGQTKTRIAVLLSLSPSATAPVTPLARWWQSGK